MTWPASPARTRGLALARGAVVPAPSYDLRNTRELRANLISRLVGRTHERGAWLAAATPCLVERRLESRYAKSGRHHPGERRDQRLQAASFIVPAGLHRDEKANAQFRHDR